MDFNQSAMEPYVDLYIAHDIEALNLLALNKPQRWSIKGKKIELVCKMLEDLYKKAQKDPLNQEQTYVLLLRFFYMYNQFLELQPDKKFVELMFGSDYQKAQVQHESIKKTLIIRYATKFGNQVSETPEMCQEKKEPTSPQNRIFKTQFVTCLEMYSALKKNYNILLVDARPKSDYDQSRMSVDNIINVPDECIISGLSANTLGKRLPIETQKVWERRDEFDVLVLFDWTTTAENFSSTKLDLLNSALVNWDFNRNYKEVPVILYGGYLEFLQVYPSLCLNPLVYLSKQNNELDELLDIDNIIYPTEVDNKIHALGKFGTKTVKKQETANDNIVDTRQFLVKENKDLSTAIQDIIAQLLKKEEEWRDNNKSLTIENNNRIKSSLIRKSDEIQDDINELERTLNSLNEQKDGVKKKFELYAEFDPQNQTLKSTELNEIIELDKDDSEKLLILDAIANERCEALKKARGFSKPNQKLTEIQTDNKIQPKMSDFRPVVNRATKPQSLGLQLLIDPIDHSEPGLCGLSNIRNTCYMNSAVQCFRNVPTIAQLFCKGLYTKYGVKSPAAIVYETACVVRYLSSTGLKYIEPTEFYQKVCTLEANYGYGHHEDSMEFFLFLMNHLSEDCSYDMARPEVMTPRQKSWYDQFQGKGSVFIDLFYHQINILQKCINCAQSSSKFEIENSFMLSIPEHEFYLEDLVQDYMADFTIPEYVCKKCKKPVLNSKTIVFQPKILVIILKRYKQVNRKGSMVFEKNKAKVHFPKENFKLGNGVYKLCSIALHQGTMNQGHYRAACMARNSWYEFNDNRVKPISIDDPTIKSQACAFFYAICNNKGSCDINVADLI